MITLEHLPQEPWIYLFKEGKTILYIGKAKNIKKRVQQYFSPWSVWKQDMVARADSIDFVVVQSDNEAYLLESNMIKQYQPYYNNLLKWDNSYVFIKITKEDFGQIFLTRKRSDDGATYIWPKQGIRELKKLLQYLRMLYKFRTSKKSIFNKWQLDSEYYFGLDAWRSVFAKLQKNNADKYIQEAQKHGLVVDKSYAEYVKLYKQIVKDVSSFFAWNTKPVEKRLLWEIKEAIADERFERAAQLRDVYTHIEHLTQKQTIFVNPQLTGTIAKILPIQGWFVFAIARLYQGKVIDIVRGKQSRKQIGWEGICSWLDAEYWLGSYISAHGEINDEVKEDYENAVYFVSNDLKKIKKKERQELFGFLDNALESYIVSTSLQEENLLNESLSTLQTRYNLPSFPYRIECIDISHLSGGWMSGWLSCLLGGLKNPKWYRRYKITSVSGANNNNDDYRALEEVLTRRFAQWTNPPDLLIIDWWKWQLGVIKKLLEDENFRKHTKDVCFVGLGKWDARKRAGKNKWHDEKLWYFATNGKIQGIDLVYDHADSLLVHIRDEAHRFANAYRKKQMSKERKK